MLEKTTSFTRKSNVIVIRKHFERVVAEKILTQENELKELRELAEYYARRPMWDYGHRAREILAKYSGESWEGK